MTELISAITSQLGVSNDQASGATGMLFKLAQEKLGDTDFSQLSGALPGLTDLVSKAPALDSSGGGAMGMLGSAVSALTGNDKLAGLASMATGLKGLGIDTGTMTKMIPIVTEFVGNNAGDIGKTLMEKFLK